MNAQAGERAPVRALRRLTVAFLVLVVVVRAGLALVDPPADFMLDLSVYRAAAAALLEGGDVYATHAAGTTLPFTYPPLAALLFIPLALVPEAVAQIGVTVLSLVALGVAALAFQRRANLTPLVSGLPGLALTLALWLALEPVVGTLALGQVNLILMALVVDLLLPWRGRGLLVGLAAAVKLTPAIFIVYLFATRRFRAGAIALAVFAGSIAAGFAVAGPASLDYWTRAVREPGFIGGMSFVGNQSLTGAAMRLARSDTGAGALLAPSLLPEPGWWWSATLVAVALAGIAGAVALHRRGCEVLGFLCCAVTALLVSPISWAHHWVWCAPIAALLWSRWAAALAAAGAGAPPGLRLGAPLLTTALPAALWTLLFVVAPIWLVDDVQGVGLAGVDLVTANLFVLAGAAFVVGSVLVGTLGRRAAR